MWDHPKIALNSSRGFTKTCRYYLFGITLHFRKLWSAEIQQGAAVPKWLTLPVTTTLVPHWLVNRLQWYLCQFHITSGGCLCTGPFYTKTRWNWLLRKCEYLHAVNCFSCISFFSFIWTLASHSCVWLACSPGIKRSMFWRCSCTGGPTDLATLTNCQL